MIGWILKRFARRQSPQPDDLSLDEETFPQPIVRTEEEILAVEEALAGLLTTGIRLGPRYDGLPLREVARSMTRQESFWCQEDADLSQVSSEALSVAILWSQRHWEEEDEETEEFWNAAVFSDHCYDGAIEGTYEQVVRRLMNLTDLWACHSIVGDISHINRPNVARCTVTIDAEPPIRPFQMKVDKDFDWTAIERLGENLPPSTSRRFGFVGDGGTALVVFLEPEDIRRLGQRLGFAFFVTPAPSRN